MKIEQYHYYKAKISYHRVDDLKAGTLPNGTEVRVLPLWVADEDEKFAGEWVFEVLGMEFFLPERDLVILQEISRAEYIGEGIKHNNP